MHAHQLVRLLLCKPAEANKHARLTDFVAVPNQHAGRVVLQFSDDHCFSVISSMPNATSMRVSVISCLLDFCFGFAGAGERFQVCGRFGLRGVLLCVFAHVRCAAGAGEPLARCQFNDVHISSLSSRSRRAMV